MSDLVWESQTIEFRKNDKMLRSVSLKREIKIPALLAGVFLYIPALWALGPCEIQNFIIEDEFPLEETPKGKITVPDSPK